MIYRSKIEYCDWLTSVVQKVLLEFKELQIGAAENALFS